METPAHGDLVYLLTKHYFGITVAKVIKLLYAHDQASLKLLRALAPHIEFEDLKKSLLILIKYQLVDYVKTVKSANQNYEYSAVPHRIFSFYRLPQFIHNTEVREGQLASYALTLLAERGIMSKAILASKLVKYSQRPSKDQLESSMSQDADGVISSLTLRKYLVEMSDNICINIERFNRLYRDDLIVETLSNFYNKEPEIKSICKVMLEISLENTSDDALITAPVPIANIRNILCPKIIPDEQRLEKYLTRLATEVNHKFFISSGTHPQKGPMFAISVGCVIDHLMKEHLCSVITSKYGQRCCRVFRVLLQRGPLLLKQIEEFIMLPTKDVREYSYMLIQEGLVRNRQVPKTLDNAPGKSVFIMSVEIDQVVFKIADICCRTVSNLLMRHDSELRRNQALLDKAKAVRELMANSPDIKMETDQTTQEWSEYFNSHELSQLNWTNKNINRLLMAKLQVDQTLCLAHIWLKLRPNTLDG